MEFEGLQTEHHLEGHHKGWHVPHKISVFALKKKVIAIAKSEN